MTSNILETKSPSLRAHNHLRRTRSFSPKPFLALLYLATSSLCLTMSRCRCKLNGLPRLHWLHRLHCLRCLRCLHWLHWLHWLHIRRPLVLQRELRGVRQQVLNIRQLLGCREAEENRATSVSHDANKQRDVASGGGARIITGRDVGAVASVEALLARGKGLLLAGLGKDAFTRVRGRSLAG
jgi:hypothetical protein